MDPDKGDAPVSASDQIDRQLAASALEKRRQGETPTSREVAALRRIEKERDNKLREQYYRDVPKAMWREWSGRQAKVINEQAHRYGLPLEGKSIDLRKLARCLHDFLADNKYKLAATGGDDELLAGPSTPELNAARLAYLKERTRISQIEADVKEGRLLGRDEVHQVYAVIAGVFRQASETLLRRFGEEAYEVLADALDAAEKQMESLPAPGEPEGQQSAH